MIFLLTWDGALKWRFLFFLREKVTILLNFILKACKLSRLTNNRKTCLSFDFVCLSCSIYISCIFEQFKLGNIKLTSSFLYSDVICIVFRSVSLGYFSRGLNTHSMFIYAIFFLQLYRQTRFPNCLYKIYDIYNVLTFLLAFLTHCIRLSNV